MMPDDNDNGNDTGSERATFKFNKLPLDLQKRVVAELHHSDREYILKLKKTKRDSEGDPALLPFYEAELLSNLRTGGSFGRHMEILCLVNTSFHALAKVHLFKVRCSRHSTTSGVTLFISRSWNFH